MIPITLSQIFIKEKGLQAGERFVRNVIKPEVQYKGVRIQEAIADVAEGEIKNTE